MKLIIEIPEEYYNCIKEIPVNTSTADMLIIRNGIPMDQCGDCISREAVMHILDEVGGDFDSPREAVVPIDYIADMVYELPSVSPQPCENAISRDAVLDLVADYDLSMGQVVKGIHALPPVSSMPKWIPVSERLPEKYKEVIVTDNETSDTYQSQYIGNGYWECDTGRFKNRIIAWMPLPEPYQPEIPTSSEGSDKE